MNLCQKIKLLIYKIDNQDEINKSKYRGHIFSKSPPSNLLYKLRYRKNELLDAFYRAKNGYSKWQPYDIKSWFAVNITHLLHDMILDLHGSPVYVDEDGNVVSIDYDEWKTILIKMYNAFKKSLNEDETDLEEDSEEARKNLKEGLELFVKYFDNLWD